MIISSLAGVVEQTGAKQEQVLVAFHQVVLGHLVRDSGYAEILDRNPITTAGPDSPTERNGEPGASRHSRLLVIGAGEGVAELCGRPYIRTARTGSLTNAYQWADAVVHPPSRKEITRGVGVGIDNRD